MKRLSWSQRAEADLFAIADAYAQVDPELSVRLLARVTEAPLLLLDRPYIGAPVGAHDLRKWSVRGTPFILFYRVAEEVSAVQIARVRHAREDWREADPE